MITATSTGRKYATQLTDGRGHYIFADVPDAGGGDLYQRPSELIAEGYAACMNITAQMLLAEQGYPMDQVETRVEMDRRPDKTVFRAKTTIGGDVPEHVKAEILERITRCPVCKLLAGEKEFLPL